MTGDEAHHAVAVRRLRVGEQVVLTDGPGRRGEGTVGPPPASGCSWSRSTTYATSRSRSPRSSSSRRSRRATAALAVEVLTEVGAAALVPWAAARSVAVWKGDRATRSRAKWQATAREAAKQARRPWHPEVAPLAGTADVVGWRGSADLALVLHEAASEPLAALEPPATGTVVLVVGPEGGLTSEEVAAFVEAGARAVRLGAEVLRTSTAGVVAAAAVLSRTPRWG